MASGLEHVGRLPSREPLFQETQRFHPAWRLGILVFVGGGMLLFLARASGFPWWAWLAVLLGAFLPLVLVTTARFRTVVLPEGLYLHFRPFHLRGWKRVRLEEARAARAVEYAPVLQYGGWGIRLVPGGRAYNVRGNRGLRVELREGRHLLIGSQRAEALESAVRRAGVVSSEE